MVPKPYISTLPWHARFDGALMIHNFTKGTRMQGRIAYLAGQGRANEHTDPHLAKPTPAAVAVSTRDSKAPKARKSRTTPGANKQAQKGMSR